MVNRQLLEGILIAFVWKLYYRVDLGLYFKTYCLECEGLTLYSLWLVTYICDLLREKGPTTIKRSFKMQLTAFFMWMLFNITTSISSTGLKAFHLIKENKTKTQLA